MKDEYSDLADGDERSPFELPGCFVEHVPEDGLVSKGNATMAIETHSLLPVFKMPSLRVHFHLFLTRATLS